MKINYPTDKWLNDYMAKCHVTKEDAELAWWDKEIELDHPTPFDLPEEKEKVAKEMRKGARAVDAYGKTRKRERKPNPDKQVIISMVHAALNNNVTDLQLVNSERQIDFEYAGVKYSLTLTAHRAPKS